MVEVIGTPLAKAYAHEDGNIKTEIRLNVSKTNILGPVSKGEESHTDIIESEIDSFETSLEDYNIEEEEF